ncbi:MAG TPA: hypothetical protein PLD25_25110 [Chloroflexota bacterium]|nr:hypothetical protein [Chloroflexota bacterium]HUM69488.1 hypothetical protein [Chloroflexota bacterium]
MSRLKYEKVKRWGGATAVPPPHYTKKHGRMGDKAVLIRLLIPGDGSASRSSDCCGGAEAGVPTVPPHLYPPEPDYSPHHGRCQHHFPLSHASPATHCTGF